MAENPWTTLSSRQVYKNPWMSIREDQVIRPDGEPGIYGVMEKARAAGVLALTPAGEVYLVGQYRYPTEEYSWEIVEGGVEEGESPLEAAQRELREEVGLVAKHWSPLGGVIHLSNCVTAEVAHLFLAKDFTEVGAQPDPWEQLEVKRVPWQEALAEVETGQIKDAMSIIAFHRLARLLA